MKRNNLAHMRPVTQLQTQFPLWACFLFCFTLPKINIAFDNRQSPKETSITTIHFQVLCLLVSCRIHVFLLISGLGFAFSSRKSVAMATWHVSPESFRRTSFAQRHVDHRIRTAFLHLGELEAAFGSRVV